MFGRRKRILIDLSREKRRKDERPRLKLSLLIAVFGVVVALLGILFGYYVWDISRHSDSIVTKRVVESPDEIMKRVAEIVMVPSRETPVVATVNNLAPLREIAFFSSAQLGDKVLFYCNAKRSILYRPLEDKVIAVADSVLEAACKGGTNPSAVLDR